MVSKRSARVQPLFLFLLFALLFSLQVLPRLTEDSPAGDETIDIVDGYYYWKGDVLTINLHPPLIKALQALPLWTMGLNFKSDVPFSRYDQRDWHFLFIMNKDRWQTIFAVSRLVTWLFGLGLGFLLFWIARRESTVFLATLLCLWAFEPSILAFSGLVSPDAPMTLLFLASVWCFRKTIEKPGPQFILAAGLLTAMAVTAKLSAVFLIPIFIGLEWMGWRDRQAQKRFQWPEFFKRWGLGLTAAVIWVFTLYLPGTLFVPGHPWPFHFLIADLRLMSVALAHPSYFQGQLGYTSHWLYYPAAFTLKSPLPFLVLLVFAIGLLLRKKIVIPAWQWVPPLVFFIAVMPVHDLGIRNLMPIYPFCFLMAARAGEWMWNRRPRGSRIFPILLAGLLGFQALSVGLHFPFQISYFNELVPQDRKIYWLGDSNLDIGQDTKRLAEEGRRRGWTHVKLAYFGIADPAWYGMDWQSWTQKDLAGPQPGWVYAINAEFIQLGPAFDPAAPSVLNSWILKVPPTGWVGDTWYYVEVPGEIKPDHSPVIVSAPFFAHYDAGH
jgi:hypothetical protein